MPRGWIAASIVLAAVAAYLVFTWDAWLANYQVRWMCDEDRGFVLMQRPAVSALGIPVEMSERDARALAAFGGAYPTVQAVRAADTERPRYELAERWPNIVRTYWGYGVLRTELSVIDVADRNRALGTTSLYRRVERHGDRWRAVRGWLEPGAEQCMPSDRVAFVARVLAAPAQ
jgi:hypothetical protein